MVKSTIKSYDSLIKRINKSNVIEEKDVLRLAHGLGREYHEVIDILERNEFRYSGYDITLAQCVKGKNYLIKHYLKNNGTRRQNKNLNPKLSEYFYLAIESLFKGENFGFTFDGFKEVTNGFWRAYAPIYTLYVSNYRISYFHFLGKDFEDEQVYLDNNYSISAYTL